MAVLAEHGTGVKRSSVQINVTMLDGTLVSNIVGAVGTLRHELIRERTRAGRTVENFVGRLSMFPRTKTHPLEIFSSG